MSKRKEVQIHRSFADDGHSSLNKLSLDPTIAIQRLTENLQVEDLDTPEKIKKWAEK